MAMATLGPLPAADLRGVWIGPAWIDPALLFAPWEPLAARVDEIVARVHGAECRRVRRRVQSVSAPMTTSTSVARDMPT